MNRKDFFSKSCRCGIISLLGMAFIPNEIKAENLETAEDDSKKLQYQLNFAQKRFTYFMKHLPKFIDDNQRIQLYKNVGESCALTYKNKILEYKGNLIGVLEKQNNSEYQESYDYNETTGELYLNGKPTGKCGCPLVSDKETPVEFCHCSKGYIQTFYEMVTGKNVVVSIEKSVLRGDDRCSFLVKLS